MVTRVAPLPTTVLGVAFLVALLSRPRIAGAHLQSRAEHPHHGGAVGSIGAVEVVPLPSNFTMSGETVPLSPTSPFDFTATGIASTTLTAAVARFSALVNGRMGACTSYHCSRDHRRRAPLPLTAPLSLHWTTAFF